MNDIEWTGFQQFLFSRDPWRFVMLGALLVMVVTPAESRADWFLKCNQRELYPEYCCWKGTAPICTAGCPSGYYEERRSKNADGDLSTCWVGTHKLCCPGGVVSLLPEDLSGDYAAREPLECLAPAHETLPLPSG
jgi:hypothetical protein